MINKKLLKNGRLKLYVKLSDAVKNDVIKKTVYDKLVAKVNSIDTSACVLKTNYDRDKSEIEKIKIKIRDTSARIKKTDYNAKLTKLENKIPDASCLATKTALTLVENKIPSVSSLVKKKIMMQESLKLKKNLLIIIMINILQL